MKTKFKKGLYQAYHYRPRKSTPPPSGGIITGVQKITGSLTTSTSGTISIPTAVSDMSRTWIIATSYPEMDFADQAAAAFHLTDTDEITYYRDSAGGSNEVPYCIYVVEFDSTVTVQRGYEHINNIGLTSWTETISSVDTTKSIIHMTTNGPTGGWGNQMWQGVTFNSSTELGFEKQRTQGIHTAWQVIEFTTGDVQHGSTSLGGTDTSVDVTLSTIDLSNTFLLFSYKINSSSYQNAHALGSFTSTTNLNFSRPQAHNVHTIYYQVADIPDFSVQDVTTTILAANSSATSTLSTVSLSTAFPIIPNMNHNGTGGNGDQASTSRLPLAALAMKAEITTTTELTVENNPDYTDGDLDCHAFIIDNV